MFVKFKQFDDTGAVFNFTVKLTVLRINNGNKNTLKNVRKTPKVIM